MRPIASLIASTSFLFSCSALILAACNYELPRVNPNLDVGGAGGAWGTSSSSGNAGSGGATSSSNAASSSAESAASSSSSQMVGICGDGSFDLDQEQCEDGNTRSGDGCDAGCFIENHDSCSGFVLEIGNETVRISSSTAGAADDITRSAAVQICGAGERVGADLVYAITPTVNGILTATLQAEYNNHFLHIRTACPGVDSDEIACHYGSTSSAPDISTLTVTTGIVLYVIVDGHLGDSGPFTLTLTLQ